MTERVGMSEFPQRGAVWCECPATMHIEVHSRGGGTEVSLIRDIVGSDVGLR